MKNVSILIVDDELELRKSVCSILEAHQTEFEFQIHEASNGEEAVEATRQKAPDIILMDVLMPVMSGLDALPLIKEVDPGALVVLMTAHGNLQDAVAAIKKGAFDYIEKPVQPHQLLEMVKKAYEAREMISHLALSDPIMNDDEDNKEFVGTSTKMRKVFTLINRLCEVDTTVLLRGENGTGKELVARAIHYNSPRKKGAFVAINCGAIPENLIESELFGHEKGAFTGAHERKIGRFQLANNGTLFLDEIAELRPDTQVKLLRVLQEKMFTPIGSGRELRTNARIVAATNRPLEKMIESGNFREDLFYRLNVMPLFLPPLRERLDDLEALVEYFIKKFNKHHSKQIRGITRDALHCLKNHSWPGNIRELENVIEHGFIIESSPYLTVHSLPDQIKSLSRSPQTQIAVPHQYSGPLDFDRFKEQMEKEFIIKALKANNGRINRTVAQANIPKNTLLRKIKKYQIDVKEIAKDT